MYKEFSRNDMTYNTQIKLYKNSSTFTEDYFYKNIKILLILSLVFTNVEFIISWFVLTELVETPVNLKHFIT